MKKLFERALLCVFFSALVGYGVTGGVYAFIAWSKFVSWFVGWL